MLEFLFNFSIYTFTFDMHTLNSFHCFRRVFRVLNLLFFFLLFLVSVCMCHVVKFVSFKRAFGDDYFA